MRYPFNWFSGLLTGGAIGAAVAILATPRSGEETRTMIRDKSLEIREGAVQALEDGREKLEDVKVDVRRRFSNLKSVGQEVYEKEKELLEKGASKAAKAVAG
jgi:gas vesicle protein